MTPEPSREQSSSYFVQDRNNLQEMERIEFQDKMFTAVMGGVLPEQPDPTSLRRVLDVGCGTGNWLIETAKTYPTIEQLIGVDISPVMIAYARAQAQAQGLDQRMQFRTMDALRPLEFAPAFFDLVNQRLAVGWLRTWQWKEILLEYQRVTRPGGVVRITEAPHVAEECNSPALITLCHLLVETSYRSGGLFYKSYDGITGELAGLMRRHGFADVQTQEHTILSRAGTQAAEQIYEDVARLFRLSLPFMQKWTRVPDNYEEIYQQALVEMQQPDFVSRGSMVTAWGIRP